MHCVTWSVQLLKAKLHVAQLLKELTGGDAKTRVDLATKADHIRDLYSRVCQAYQTLQRVQLLTGVAGFLFEKVF